MKIYKILLFAFAIGMVTFVSCSKEELEDTNYSNPNPPTNDLGKLSCFVAEGFWEADSYSASYVNDVVKIEAISKNNDTMIFNIIIEDDIHYYYFNNANPNFAIYKNSVDESAYYSSSLAPTSANDIGHVEILIDTANGIISGSFAYKAYKNTDGSVTNITEGEFSNIKYNNVDISNNSMSAVVFNDTINAFNPIYASKNYQNYFEIRGFFNTNEYIGLYFNGNSLSTGDHIILTGSNYAYHYNGSNIYTYADGYIDIVQYNDTTNTLKGNFEFYFGTDSVRYGHFDVKYFEQ